jgi:hypothetical protein
LLLLHLTGREASKIGALVSMRGLHDNSRAREALVSMNNALQTRGHNCLQADAALLLLGAMIPLTHAAPAAYVEGTITKRKVALVIG